MQLMVVQHWQYEEQSNQDGCHAYEFDLPAFHQIHDKALELICKLMAYKHSPFSPIQGQRPTSLMPF